MAKKKKDDCCEEDCKCCCDCCGGDDCCCCDCCKDHGVKDVSSALEDLDCQGWEDTEEADFDNVPADDYQVKIDKATLNKAKSSGRLQVSMEMTISSGKYKGRKLFKHAGLETEENRGRFRGELARLGIAWPKKAKKLPKTLNEEMVDSYAEVSVKDNKSGDGQWVNFKKAIEEGDLDEDGFKDDCCEECCEPKKKDKKKEDCCDCEECCDCCCEDDCEKADGSVEVEFTDSDITKKLKKKITALAADPQMDFDPSDYCSISEMLADMGEYVGIKGKYKDAEKLFGEVEAAKPKGSEKKKKDDCCDDDDCD